MKQYFLNGLGSIQRPVAVMLAFLPIGSLVVACGLVRWTRLMVTNEPMVDPNVAEVLAGFATLFREYAIPVLVLTVTLAVLNLLATFAVRTRKARVLDGSASVPEEATV
jgi:hypothetical protein